MKKKNNIPRETTVVNINKDDLAPFNELRQKRPDGRERTKKYIQEIRDKIPPGQASPL